MLRLDDDDAQDMMRSSNRMEPREREKASNDDDDDVFLQQCARSLVSRGQPSQANPSSNQPPSSLHPTQVMERYAGKRGKECALCEHKFAAVNLPMEVTYKAVMDLREGSWGVDIPPNPRLCMVPRCYDKVHICRLCSQFFATSELYRPLILKPRLAEGDDPDMGEFETQMAPAFFRK